MFRKINDKYSFSFVFLRENEGLQDQRQQYQIYALYLWPVENKKINLF
jgi:hypothetical protein